MLPADTQTSLPPTNPPAPDVLQSITPPPSSPSVLNLDALFNNPLFAGGIGLTIFGASLAAARKSVIIVSTNFRRRLLLNLEITKKDESYKWFLLWMARQHQQSLATPPKTLLDRLSQRYITRMNDLSMRSIVEKAQNGEISKMKFLAEPGYGKHIIRYGGGFIAVKRERQTGANMTTGEQFETIQLTTLFSHSHLFESMFGELGELAFSENAGKTTIYTPRVSEWVPFGNPVTKRPLSSVVLDEGVMESIMDDVQDFLSQEEWYTENGIPYRRGYLLYGPPGTGKSSFVKALAGELDYGIANISLSQKGLHDDALISLLTKLPHRTIVLLEDADAAFANRRQTDADGYAGSNVTFSGLLNALDGVAAGEHRIAFLTTNHIDKLDAALIRPGRVDVTMRIGEATRYQAGGMWDKFYGKLDVDHKGRERFLARLEEVGLLAKEGSKETPRYTVSTADIQRIFIEHKMNPEGTISKVETLVNTRVGEPETPIMNAA